MVLLSNLQLGLRKKNPRCGPEETIHSKHVTTKSYKMEKGNNKIQNDTLKKNQQELEKWETFTGIYHICKLQLS